MHLPPVRNGITDRPLLSSPICFNSSGWIISCLLVVVFFLPSPPWDLRRVVWDGAGGRHVQPGTVTHQRGPKKPTLSAGICPDHWPNPGCSAFSWRTPAPSLQRVWANACILIATQPFDSRINYFQRIVDAWVFIWLTVESLNNGFRMIWLKRFKRATLSKSRLQQKLQILDSAMKINQKCQNNNTS